MVLENQLFTPAPSGVIDFLRTSKVRDKRKKSTKAGY